MQLYIFIYRDNFYYNKKVKFIFKKMYNLYSEQKKKKEEEKKKKENEILQKYKKKYESK